MANSSRILKKKKKKKKKKSLRGQELNPTAPSARILMHDHFLF